MLHRRKTLDLQDTFKEIGESGQGTGEGPFLTWEWNDRLDSTEIRRQVRSFAEAGFRGFIITPAAGLLSRPLETDWMDALETAVDEARRQHLEVCLRERIHLPASPVPITEKQTVRSLCGSILKMEVLPASPDGALPATTQNTVALYSAQKVGGKLLHLLRLVQETAETSTISENDSAPPEPSPDLAIPLSPLANPVAADPNPVAADPNPVAADPNPVAADPNPVAADPNPVAADPNPVAADPNPVAADPNPIDFPMTENDYSATDAATPPGENSSPVESDAPSDVDAASATPPLSLATDEEHPVTGLADEALKTDCVFLHLYAESSGALDLLSAEAVRTFIDGPPENYYREFGAEFGKTITAFVVEVPGFDSPPWSQAIPSIYEEMFAEDLLNILPCVFFEVDGIPQGRIQYWSAVSALLARSCTGQVQAWCINREIRFWARFQGSGSLLDQMTSNAGIMSQYAAAGGILLDCATRPSDMTLALKQASSRVRQGEGPRLLSEWSLDTNHPKTFAHTLSAAVQAVALGATDLCTARAPYSLRGFRKFQLNSYFHPQQPSWSFQRQLNKFLARLHFLLNQGQPATSLAVIHPLRSAWQAFPGSLEAVDKQLQQLTAELMEGSCDFDFLDETFLSSAASIHENRLRVGHSSYRTILVPAWVNFAPSTVAILKKFLDAGGSVYRIGTPAKSEDVETADQQVLGRTNLVPDTRLALEEIRKTTRWDVQRRSEGTATLICREHDAGRFQFLFLANSSPEETLRIRISTPLEGRLELWDCETGVVTPLDNAVSMAGLSAEVIITAGGLVVLGLDTARPPWSGLWKAERILESVEIDGGWNLSLKDPNILRLDRCYCKVGNDDWRPAKSLTEGLTEIHTAAGTNELLLRYSIDIHPDLERKNLYLAIEDPSRWKIIINGVPLPSNDTGSYFFERARKFEVARLLNAGKNIVMLSCPIPLPLEPAWPDWRITSQSPFSEQLFLIGQFRVESTSVESASLVEAILTSQRNAGTGEGTLAQDSYVIAPVRALVEGGHLENEGFPTFRGAVELQAKVLLPHRPGERIFLEVDELAAAALSVRVNKKAAGTLLWPPYRLDITEFARPGKNSVSLELTTDGPTHLPRRFGVGHVFIRYTKP